MQKSTPSPSAPFSYGLKLWSINHAWFAEGARLCQTGVFNFIELYVVPGKTDQRALAALKGLDVRIHAPHENHDFNVFSLNQATEEMFRRDVLATADLFGSKTIVVHAGVGTDPTVFLDRLGRISDPRIIIENMPYHGIHGEICFGYSLDQLQILHSHGLKLCVDIGHTVKSAATQALNPKTFFQSIEQRFSPAYFHISDGNTTVLVDEHLDIGQGTYDFPWIKRWLDEIGRKRGAELVFEVPKNGKNLANDIANLERFKKL